MFLKWTEFEYLEKVYFRSQILEHPSIGKYWNISGVPVFKMCWCYLEAHNAGTHVPVWDLKYTFSEYRISLEAILHLISRAFIIFYNWKC